MLRSLIAAAISLAVFASAAEARQRHRASPACVETGTVMQPICGMSGNIPTMTGSERREARRVARGQYIADQMQIGGVTPRNEVRYRARPRHKHKVRDGDPYACFGGGRYQAMSEGKVCPGYDDTRIVPQSRSAGGLDSRLASKVAEIESACGSRLVSGVRHTKIAGTRHWSQHANGTAADMSGNASCIYGQLTGWPGGYSTDYARMGHVHISIGGPEAGLRFVHGGSHRRHARRVHHRYASR